MQVVERWILARLRHQTFFSLVALNRAIAALLVDLNQRAFKKLAGNRASAFAELDAPLLRPLPPTRMTHRKLTQAQVVGRLGLSQNRVSYLEQHPDELSFKQLLGWSAAVGLELRLGERESLESTNRAEW